ncbi:retinol dehydrogenase 12 [Xylaria bambusicola]|uniref:retinol dehydrogenase 12 n=1 Tax=Xylaria bambusicola TaxID=326684 RepID=UPI0020079945|nr:retinol dehydrogenase 12 [Xylaria bambusicola]KAI0505750.1 retinol dehydrogenase 12 [Xylaria bambusicola]
MSSQLANEAPFEESVLAFFYRQWLVRRKPVPAGTDLSSQVAIVTGSNSGLGLEAGRQLLQLGLSHLILAVRSQSRGDKAAEGLRKEFPNADVSVWLLDMSSYDSITTFVERCKSLPKINMVILNAGLKGAAVFTTVESTGHEYSFQVNYISTALLTILLLPVLKSKRVAESKQPTLTVVTSDSAFWTSIETPGPILAQLDKAEDYTAMSWYQKAKLLQYFFISKLAAEVNSDDVIVNLANPGLCRGTAFENAGDWSVITTLMFDTFKRMNGRSVATGASTYVDAAVVKGVESHGSYVSEWAIRPYPKILYTDVGAQIRERLWEETMEDLSFAGVSKVIEQLKR